MSEHDKVNILMVDDQPAKLLSYEAILGELGENLIKAGSGREALEHLLKTDIAVVLMDVSMPELDGFELAEIIHQHPRYQKTAIIFISAVHLTDLDQLKGYAHGAVDYISVPVIPELLRAKVSVFAELYRKTQQLERLNRELEQRVAERTAELEASTARLRESEASFRAIFENAGIGISVLDQHARLLQANTTMQEMLGYSEAEAVNLEMSAFTHPEDVLSDIDSFRGLCAGDLDRYQVEKRYYRKDGQLLWGRLTATSIRDTACHVIGMLEDITESKRAEERFRQVVEDAPNGMIMVNQAGTIVLVNAQVEQLFGYQKDELLGHPVEVLVPERFRARHPGHRAAFFTAPQTRAMGAGRDLYGLRKDGTEFPVEIGLNPLPGEEGLFVLASIIDITARKRAEEELQRRSEALQRLNTELEHSNRELDAFAYIASHYLKEPLRGIHNFSHFLLEDYSDKLDTEGVHKLNTLMRLTQRMEALIETLLHYSHVGRVELAMEKTDVQEVVEETLELLAPRLQESHVEVRIPARLPVVQADRVRMGEIFNNLIVNAIKYNDKAEKWVEIGCESSPGNHGAMQPVFYVRDNGIGIAAQHHESVFRIFRRLHGREEYGGGTGAGLTIVRKIVERHGGHIWLVSQPDTGSTFYFTLGKSGERAHANAVAHSAD
jgi:PAS domain S-box-containing protein